LHYNVAHEDGGVRVSTELKTDLEREARRRKISLAKALDLAAQEWLKRTSVDIENDEREQKRLHQALRSSSAFFRSAATTRLTACGE
jgi:hypothetical protein